MGEGEGEGGSEGLVVVPQKGGGDTGVSVTRVTAGHKQLLL